MWLNNNSNKIIDITSDVIHELAYDFNVTMREINKEVWNNVFNIVSKCNNTFNNNR